MPSPLHDSHHPGWPLLNRLKKLVFVLLVCIIPLFHHFIFIFFIGFTFDLKLHFIFYFLSMIQDMKEKIMRF